MAKPFLEDLRFVGEQIVHNRQLVVDTLLGGVLRRPEERLAADRLQEVITTRRVEPGRERFQLLDGLDVLDAVAGVVRRAYRRVDDILLAGSDIQMRQQGFLRAHVEVHALDLLLRVRLVKGLAGADRELEVLCGDLFGRLADPLDL